MKRKALALHVRFGPICSILMGYISHQLFIDQEAPSHLLVVSQWRSREVADRIKEEYSESETVRQLKPLLTHERGRWVYSEDKLSE